jgi:hypothetical protein
MSFPSFKDYLVEEQREVFFTFGRMNPPTIGHGKLLKVMATKAGKNPYKVYLSQSSDAKKNPLTYEQKIKHVRKMFPKQARNVIMDKKLRNVFEVATSLYDQGFNRITMVVGADRITEFKTLLEKYNGEKARHGFYNFERITVVSAGERDPDADDVTGMSASKQRENAKNNDFTTFAQGVPSTMSSRDAKKLFNDVRSGMGLKEMTQFKNHVELEPVSDMREKFVEGVLFNEGDQVMVKETGEMGRVSRLGTNYLILDMADGSFSRRWITDVELIDEAGWGGSGIMRDLMPQVDAFLDRTINKKKYKFAIRTFLDLRKKNPGDARNNLIKTAKMTDTDVRTLDKMFRQMVKKGIMPKHLVNYQPTFAEGKTDNWYKDQPEWGTPAATKKAKKNIAGQEKADVKEVRGDEVDAAKQRISFDKKQDRQQDRRERDRKEREYDKVLDRARLARARRKNRQTNRVV